MYDFKNLKIKTSYFTKTDNISKFTQLKDPKHTSNPKASR